ncbi:MAG TPA: cyclic nucleotide-binding domain-containing protein [Bdellovibrionota bacterium]|nr:cyclic nucleotide-binding domain-containing protein [Bdellovibrionota bacterium]
MGTPARPTTTTATVQATGQQTRRLKKGELLFAEGETSRSMYFVKSGMLRIYKKKGDSNIEIDTIHAGQVVGELAFLDGNPRSASGEALTDCEMIEVSGPVFQDVLTKMPDWLKILLKTVVGRLRTASTRIRQLETASTSFDYSSKDGKRSSHYVYLSPIDVLKISTGLLLVASRNGTSVAGGIDVRVGLLQRYTNQIMGVPVAKITTFMDILEQSEITRIVNENNSTKVILEDIDFLEQMITYLNEENLLEPSKRHDLSVRGFLIMGLMAKHMDRFGVDQATGMKLVNISEIRKLETPEGGKEPFRMEEFTDLVKLGYASSLNIKSQEEMFTAVKSETFLQAYRLQRVVMSIQAVNEQKRKAGAR